MQHAATKEFVRVPWNKGKIAGQKPPLKRSTPSIQRSYTGPCPVQSRNRQQAAGL
jgi:hypothetical protein